MITRNFDVLANSDDMGLDLWTSGETIMNTSGSAVTLSGRYTANSTYRYYCLLRPKTFGTSPSSQWAPCIVFGQGNAPEDYTDYKITDPVSITGTEDISHGYDVATRLCKFSGTAKIANTTDNDIVITEWGIYATVTFGSSTSNDFDYTLLTYRKLLDTPITVHSGETVKIKLSYEIPFSSNEPIE